MDEVAVIAGQPFWPPVGCSGEDRRPINDSCALPMSEDLLTLFQVPRSALPAPFCAPDCTAASIFSAPSCCSTLKSPQKFVDGWPTSYKTLLATR
jgi:hypothetical protein